MLEPGMIFPKLTTVRAERVLPGDVVWGWLQGDAFIMRSEGHVSEIGAVPTKSGNWMVVASRLPAFAADDLLLVEA